MPRLDASEELSSCLLLDKTFPFCPGCGHGIVLRILAETIVSLGIREKTVCVLGIGCGTMIDQSLNLDIMDALHGRAPAVATGLKLAEPEKIIFTYQGDGDLASIGLGEFIHAAARGFPLTSIMINNSIYGMTGGQMGACTLIGQSTATTPNGRMPQFHGFPIKIPEMIRELEGVAYVARYSISNPKSVLRAKLGIKKAFQCQLEKRGFSYIEILSPCVTGLKKPPPSAMEWIRDELEKHYKIGAVKVPKLTEK